MNCDKPVLILYGGLGGLSILRSLAPLGVECWAIDKDPRCPAFLSRYSKGRRVLGRYDAQDPRSYLELVVDVGRRIGRRAILIPTSDVLVLFAARHREALSSHFDFPCNSIELSEGLISKLKMSRLAQEHGVPVPQTLLPRNEGELLAQETEFRYPLMLKPALGSGAAGQANQNMVLVRSRDELLAAYRAKENPAAPNMMLQEYIPGGDDQIYIFNGYFDSQSRCLAGFTGRKLRQHPIHCGCASMGEQRTIEVVSELMIRFLGALGYRGIVDAGLRYDARDGRYKLLDVNPRVGQAFRLFLSLDGSDVVRCMYGDLTGQPVGPLVQREGRRWVIEDYDLVSFAAYRREGSLGLREWLASYRGVQEGAWWSWRDPVPFAVTAARMTSRAVRYLAKQLRVADVVREPRT